ncbi:MAG: hypothetical protein PHO02_04310 [Candidatus Nanoarchaeia archaeon]|nr:hypothetical protein [Candidatus Nanoarchaeia archaeon]
MASHAATADEMGMGGYSSPQPRKKGFLGWANKWTNADSYAPSEKGKKTTKNKALWVFMVLALFLVGTYAYYWAASPGGQRSLVQAKNLFMEYNPATWYQKQIGKAQDIGNIWSSEPVTAEKKGILFESFKPTGSEEIPQGSIALFTYGLKLSNADVARTPLTLTCEIKENNLQGQILPSNPMYVTGTRITDNARCRLPKEMTSALSGTVEVMGGVSFPFKTEDVRLKVYFTSRAMEDSLPSGEDLFSYMHIGESQPIRAEYKGEPIEIGLGVSTENIQPVVLDETSNPLVGITINNRWDGNMTKLTSLKLVLPRELTINQELSANPNEICPFTLSRQGRETNEYKASEEFISAFTLASERLRSFECWLDASPDMLGNAPYMVKEYKVDAEYEYELPKKTSTITVRKIASAEEGTDETGEVVNPLI